MSMILTNERNRNGNCMFKKRILLNDVIIWMTCNNKKHRKYTDIKNITISMLSPLYLLRTCNSFKSILGLIVKEES